MQNQKTANHKKCNIIWKHLHSAYLVHHDRIVLIDDRVFPRRHTILDRYSAENSTISFRSVAHNQHILHICVKYRQHGLTIHQARQVHCQHPYSHHPKRDEQNQLGLKLRNFEVFGKYNHLIINILSGYFSKIIVY